MHSDCFTKYEELIVGYMAKAGRGRTWNEKQVGGPLTLSPSHPVTLSPCPLPSLSPPLLAAVLQRVGEQGLRPGVQELRLRLRPRQPQEGGWRVEGGGMPWRDAMVAGLQGGMVA